VHKLAGTAAMFGEPELGTCAATLERALTRSDSLETCAALARKLLGHAESHTQADDSDRAGRGKAR
jgi:two-component system, sensor histidine kinase